MELDLHVLCEYIDGVTPPSVTGFSNWTISQTNEDGDSKENIARSWHRTVPYYHKHIIIIQSSKIKPS